MKSLLVVSERKGLNETSATFLCQREYFQALYFQLTTKWKLPNWHWSSTLTHLASNPCTFTLVQPHKQSRAACCSEPRPASLRYSFLLKGRAICSQHNTEKSQKDPNMKTVFSLLLKYTWQMFYISSMFHLMKLKVF